MAKRKYSKMTKIQPSVESFTFIPKTAVPQASPGPGVVPGIGT